MRYRDRRHAGRLLGERLTSLRSSNPVILGLPRGGVPVADEVARALGAPVDVIVVRKLGVPFQPELAMGAVGEDGVQVLNRSVIQAGHISETELELVAGRERKTVEERVQRFRRGRPGVPLAGRTVVIVDDGIATGSTARAAVQVVRAHGAARVVVAVPVAPPDSVRELEGVADEVIALQTPAHFAAVGSWYDDFGQTSDEEVERILSQSTPAEHDVAVPNHDVAIPIAGAQLSGQLMIPDAAIGVVLFAHGSGSSRHSPRNRYVAATLNTAGIGTLLFDLLTDPEAEDRRAVFDIPLLAARLTAATRWFVAQEMPTALPIGYLGASTGAGAALWAAAEPDNTVAAVVSRGGRPDLAMTRLSVVRAPTLLIVGSRDETVLQLNVEAARHLQAPHRVAVVPGATHLFEEPGTLATAARLAQEWFTASFTAAAARRS